MESLEHILDSLAGRRVLVVGLARSGVAAARTLAAAGARVTGSDRQPELAAAAELRQAGVELHLGGDGSDLVAGQQLLVLSPGVWLDAPVVHRARAAGVPYLGELELAWRLVRLRLGRSLPMAAVTGTNGKSTTAALLAHLARRAGRRVFLGGNIGRPLLEVLQQDWEPQLLVVEVSSFQLEHLSVPTALDPQVALWLNLTADHLDRHGSLEEYARCKQRLFLGQGGDDWAVYNADDALLPGWLAEVPGRRLTFGRDPGQQPTLLISKRSLRPPGGQELTLDNPRLAGEHNAENAAAAVLAAGALQIDPAGWQAALDDFPGLEHRLEPVVEVGGVRFVDDSKGTNVAATLKSLTSFAAPVVLLAGGRGKGDDYRRLRPLVSTKTRAVVLLGEEAARLERDLQGCAPLHRAQDMHQAVRLAWRLARPGEVVLLSPACASFDMFSDYAERGRVFAAEARRLAEEQS